ncbi:GGDEF domain-containing protein [Fusibacter tunisiensis]|uniref:Diguanylate cyclase (GGDEF)-like protein n=1 Tax=Fusibacter tunisiensis TaxID=1008308 RepID=A0ABS2MT47_9FIRM|nr:GGDEF domain-containing protein [Fusibacter tunisiensis]MBM7562574.1 diguanylate cyclase (GGDEF)-like protein [Fusibacter tunisiensis]
MEILTLLYANAIGYLVVFIFMVIYTKNHLNKINRLHLFSQAMFTLAFTTFAISEYPMPISELLTAIGNIGIILGSAGLLLTILQFVEHLQPRYSKVIYAVAGCTSGLSFIWGFTPGYSHFRIGIVTLTLAIFMTLAAYALYRYASASFLGKAISLFLLFIASSHYYRLLEIFDFKHLYALEIPSIGNAMIMLSMFMYLFISGSGIVMLFKEKSDEQLYTLATFDHLTGCYNRTVFVEKAETLLIQNTGNNTYIALVMVDIDQFKAINDAYGHITGDEILVKFAKILKRETRSDELIGRYGGDEFILFLKGNSPDELYAKCERLRLVIQQLSKDKIRITGSFGAVIQLNKTVHSYDLLVREADQALFNVKHAGRNAVSVRYL